MPNVAVLTNDLQYEFLEKTPERKLATERVIPPFCSFLDGIRALGQVVVHLQLVNNPDDPQVRRRYRDYIPVVRGTPGSRLVETFVHPSDIVMEKPRDSGFYDTALDEKLQELGVKTVIVTGLQTQICVQTTAADAFFRGYNVHVPADCVFSAREDDRKRALDWMAAYCATITSAPEILAQLKADGDLPRRAPSQA
ncbi:cysteine hydrolase family protein [Cystobacter ferrugineus]|uniref:Isochorismatase n=1 Tax=Cystobacter ferrugineus TaxID=83449 RepID=A0A1L9AWB5_9BACT|nr:cysteine hydrolase [Cystobacter ferrugineus]OJH34305.1 isochorismatase [Cystobacter ferrugineus]